jgi:ATP/maltotriose-dependent transcriptional regulator MalT
VGSRLISRLRRAGRSAIRTKIFSLAGTTSRARRATSAPPRPPSSPHARGVCGWPARDVPGGRAFLAEVLDERQPPDPSRWRALALHGDGLFAFWAGDAEGARRRNEEAFALAQDLDDSEALLYAHLGLSRVALEHGDHARAREHAAAARALAVRLGEAVGQAPLHMEAQSTRLADDYNGAAERDNADAAEQYFAQLPPSDDPYVQALMRVNRAGVAYRRGNVDEARELLASVDGEEFASDDREELEWLKRELERAAT